MTEVSDEAGLGPDLSARLEAYCDRLILAAGASPRAELSVRVVSPDEMSALNREWRGVQGPTDVLSFKAGGEGFPAPEDILGDVVLCWEVIRDNSSDIGHPPETELHWAVTHGLLHILGWDHGDPESLGAMEKRTAELMIECGEEVSVGG